MSVRTALCFGDSNTHGTMAMRFAADRRRHPKPDRWTSVMASQLGDNWDVIPEGHPGRTAVFDDPVEGAHKNAMRSVHAILESHRPLDVVLVMLGTNDLKSRFAVSAHDVALGVLRLVMEIGRTDCGPGEQSPKVVLMAPVSVIETGIFTETFAGAADKSVVLADLLRAAAERQNAGFLDANDVATVDPVDGIHLGAEAHAGLGLAAAQAVQRMCN